MFGKRTCLQCARSGVKPSTIFMPGAATCDYCGAEHEVARFRNVPYIVAAGVLVLLVSAWFSGLFSREAFVALLGVWLVFDVVWGRIVPLQLVSDDSIEG